MNVKANLQLSGEFGGTVFADTAAHTGDWIEMYALTAAVVSASTSNIVGLNGFSLAIGQSISGVFRSITLTSGQVVAYNRKSR